MSRRKRTWLIAVGLTCGAAVVGALGGLLLNDSKADASAEWGKALLTLFVAILISGLLAFILSEHSSQQQQRSADREQTFQWLRWLVEANNRVHASRFLLNAKEGTATISCGAQVRNIIKARVTLRSLQEDLPDSERDAAEHVREMIKYLGAVGEEYTANYYKLAWAQRIHEEYIKRQLSRAELPKEPPNDPEDPWLVLRGGDFPKLIDMLEQGGNYKKNYGFHYGYVKGEFRKHLRRLGVESG